MREKIAIFLDTKKHSGGAYQELIYMIERLDTLYNWKIEIVIISNSTDLHINIKGKKFTTHYLSMNFLERHIAFLRNYDPSIRRLKK